MRKLLRVTAVLILLLFISGISCSLLEGDQTSEPDTKPSPVFQSPPEPAIGEGVIISALPRNELPQMPEVSLPQDVTEDDILQAAHEDGDIPALLGFETGSVTIKRNGESIEASDGMEIFPGDSIVVESDTTAVIHTFDGSKSILEGPCEIKFLISQKSTEGKTVTTAVELELESGSVLNKVGDLFSPSSSHKVRTANTIAGAWGTIYRVVITPGGKTLVIVSEDEVKGGYIGKDSHGKPKPLWFTINAAKQNSIEIPPIDPESIKGLANSLGLGDGTTDSVLDHLDDLLNQQGGNAPFEAPANFTTRTDAKNGYAISYPKHWRIISTDDIQVESDGDQPQTLFVAGEAGPGGNNPTVSVVVTPVGDISGNIHDNAQSVIDQTAAAYQDYNFVLFDQQNRIIGGEKALMVEYGISVPGGKSTTIQLALIKGGNLWTVACAATPDTFSQQKSDLKLILESFKLL